jgi:uncharacterized protein (DUF362 family)/Pyruvate/2-oxoacid:ferredoxin oxidoreductase delta subunit
VNEGEKADMTGVQRGTVVALVRCEDYDRQAVESAVRRSVDLLGGMAAFVKPGNQVLLKPNLLAARAPERRITTDPEIVRSVARLVVEAGGKPAIGDSPALEPFQRVARKTGMKEVADELGLELVNLVGPAPVPLREGAVFRNLELSSRVMDADVVINLPKLKTHSQMLFTLGVKNLFGTVVAQRKAEWHYMAGVDRDTFASLHLDVYQAIRPALTILDGVWGMEGHGPANGKPRRVNLVAAATDAVALDVSICQLLGTPLRSFPLYRAAKARGIGETEVNRISLRGDPPKSFQIEDFEVPSLDSLGLLPGMFDWFTKRFLVSKPVQEEAECVDCGECAAICPAEAIQLKAKKLTFDYDRCIRCYCCQEVCPQNSIQFHRGLLVRLLNRFNR